uniref:Uncharacterized protein n=1 Tax=Arundo donax TaxID=35708 RepID=A0A0A9HMD2_ARUDO
MHSKTSDPIKTIPLYNLKHAPSNKFAQITFSNVF